jgi:hypothetical protein
MKFFMKSQRTVANKSITCRKNDDHSGFNYSFKLLKKEFKNNIYCIFRFIYLNLQEEICRHSAAGCKRVIGDAK